MSFDYTLGAYRVLQLKNGWKKPTAISVWEEKWLQSTSDSGQYLVVDIWAHKYCGMMHFRWWHETQVPVIWSFEDSGLNFISLEAVTQDPGCVSASVITTCQCRFSLPLKSHPLFFTSFVELLCPHVVVDDNSSNAWPISVTLLYL